MTNADKVETRPTVFESQRSAYDFNSFVALSFLNILLSITASLGNILIIFVLGKESSLHPPSRLLLRSLAFTDLCVGLVVQPVTAVHSISILTEQFDIYPYSFAGSYISSAILSGVSLFILTFISVDRLLALKLGMRYRQTVTTKRVRAFVIFSWVINVANGMANFLPNKFVFYIVCFTGISLCAVISTFCYRKIFRILRVQQMNVQAIGSQAQPNRSPPLNVERYKKTVSSALWVHFTLLACYLPYSIVSGVKAVTGEPFPVAEGFTATLIFFNSSLNPVLYCWRIREVRQAVKDTIRQFCACICTSKA